MADPTTPQQALDAALAALDTHAGQTAQAAALAETQHPTAGNQEETP